MNSTKKSKLDRIFSLRYLLYDFVKLTGAIGTFIFVRPKKYFIDKKAYKKLPKGYIISSNHLQYIDPVLVHCAFPFRRIFSVAMEKMFNTPLKSWFFSHINCIKVDRNNASVETIRSVGEVLKANKVVCIFPEGGIQKENSGAAFKPGCAMMSIINEAPILPVFVEKRKSIWRTTKIIVGAPVYPKDIVGESKALPAIEKLNNHLYEKEQELCDYYKSLCDGKE